MLSQHHAIGLQTGCMVIVLAPVVEAARLPRVCPMALGYGLPPCNNNNGQVAARPRQHPSIIPKLPTKFHLDLWTMKHAGSMYTMSKVSGLS